MAQSTVLTGNDPMEVLISVRCEQVLDSIIALLEADGYDKPSSVIYVAPGQAIVWDNCCGGGQLTARLSSLVPHFTGDYKNAYNLDIDYWTTTIEITLLRCAATVDDQMKVPTPARLTQDGVQGAADMRVMLQAITSAVEIDQDGNERAFVDNVPVWLPQGPDGGCYGNQWSFSYKLDPPK